MNVFLNGDPRSAQMLLAQKAEFRDLERAYARTHLDRLAWQTPESIETSSLHLDVINDFRRINSHICSIAYPILEQAGLLTRPSARKDPANGLNGKSDRPVLPGEPKAT
jgi:phosphate:Na+ symporter